MEEREYHLCQEPWICVLEKDYHTEKVTLEEAIIHADRYRGLAGETETQNIAILRLLLAVLHTVFSRQDENGAWTAIDTPKEARRRWKALWDAGAFPEELIHAYFVQWWDRFWLFDPKYPFYQVPGIEKDDKKYPVKKMNGLLVESKTLNAQKPPLFFMRNGEEKEKLSYGEAARWLVYLQNFDDVAAKNPSPRLCHVGQLGVVIAKGTTLFETMMLNLTLLCDGQKLWGDPRPIWEREQVAAKALEQIAIPDNQPEILSMQCRRVLLHREYKEKEWVVTKYSLLAGEYIDEESAFAEQMTFWEEKKKKGISVIKPKKHDKSHQMWRDFSFLLGKTCRKPGVVTWVGMLYAKGLLPKKRLISFEVLGVEYGSHNSGIVDSFEDSLDLQVCLLNDIGNNWQQKIVDEVERCGNLVDEVEKLVLNLEMASGGNYKIAAKKVERAKEQAYYRLDIPFRQWLLQIEPEQELEQQTNHLMKWRRISRDIIMNLGNELVNQVGNSAFIGRMVKKEGKKDAGYYCSASESFYKFREAVKTVIQIRGRMNHE